MRKNLTTNQFQKIIHSHYRVAGRAMPWRDAENPYHIFISEAMLQQTQVERVREKYDEFIKKFPNFRALSEAPLSEILRAWQGLGYNRRALFLKRAAEEITCLHGGKLPRAYEDLTALSGIGPATARAIRAFAFNEPEVFTETNIRSVYLHFFFPKTKNVSDKKLLPFIEKTLDRANPREWYYALMDYGAMLKKTGMNPSRRSAHHHAQSRFRGSIREARGAVVRFLLQESPRSLKEIQRELRFEKGRITRAVRELEKEGFLAVHKSKIQIISKYAKGSSKSK